VKVVSEEKPKRRPGPGGVSASPPKDISGQVSKGWDKTKRWGKPIPSGHTTPEEVKKAVKKGVNERNE
jgi:hypothetical protein